MRWHGVYRRFVLAPHYRFARERLVPHFFDALTAYALELARLGIPKAKEAVFALRELRTLPLPSFTGEVEDVFFSRFSSSFPSTGGRRWRGRCAAASPETIWTSPSSAPT